MMKLKIEFAENKCLSTIRSTEMIPILLELIQQENIIKTPFYVTLQFDPHLVFDNYSFTHFFTPGCEICVCNSN